MTATTALGRQIRDAADGHGSADGRVESSLLFKSREAAHVDVRTVHQLARNGLLELQRLDARMAPFSKSLFDEPSKTGTRDVLSLQAEHKLNSSIQAFLCLLSQYMLLRPAHKCLEYLVRVYHIHKFNKDDVLHAALPFHATRTFGMISKLCLGRNASGMARAQSYWAVLGNSRRLGNPIDRESLVNYCSKIPGFVLLGAVAENVKCASDRNIESKPHIGFYVALVTEVLDKKSLQLSSDTLLMHLLPYVAAFLGRSPHVELVSASLVIAAKIGSSMQLRKSVQATLIEAVAKAATSTRVISVQANAIRCLLVLFQTQQPGEFPPKAFAAVSRLEGLVDLVLQASTPHNKNEPCVDISAFVAPFLGGLAERCFVRGVVTAPRYFATLLTDFVTRIPMAAHAKEMTRLVLYLNATRSQTDICVARQVLCALQCQCRESVEMGVALFARGAASASAGSKYDAEQVEQVVSDCTGCGTHTLVTEAGTTLLFSVQHSSLAVRRLGLKKLNSTMSTTTTEDRRQVLLINDCFRAILLQQDGSAALSMLTLPRLLELVSTVSVLQFIERLIKFEQSVASDELTIVRAITVVVKIANGASNDRVTLNRCFGDIVECLLLAAAGSDTLRHQALHAVAVAEAVAPALRRIYDIESEGERGESVPAGVSKSNTTYRRNRKRFVGHLLQRIANNVCSSVTKIGDSIRTCEDESAALRDVRMLAAGSEISTVCRGFALLVLTATLNLLPYDSEHNSAVCWICRIIMKISVSLEFKSVKVPKRSRPPCWSTGSALPPKPVLSQFMRLKFTESYLPQGIMLHCIRSVISRVTQVDAGKLPVEIFPSSLILPLHLDAYRYRSKDNNFDDDTCSAVDAAAWAQHERQGSSYDESEQYKGRANSVHWSNSALENNNGLSLLHGPTNSPLVTGHSSELDVKQTQQNSLILPGILHPTIQILASAFTVLTSTVGTEAAAPIVEALLFRHLLTPYRTIRKVETRLHPVLRFLRLFWSEDFSIATQYHSVRLSAAFVSAEPQFLTPALSSLTGCILASIQNTSSQDLRVEFLQLFCLMKNSGITGLPPSIASAVAEQYSSLSMGAGYLAQLLEDILAPVEHATKSSGLPISQDDILNALERLTDIAVSESADMNSKLLTLLCAPLKAWAHRAHTTAAKRCLANLRIFVKSNAALPISRARKHAIKSCFDVLSDAADSRDNLPLIELVLRTIHSSNPVANRCHSETHRNVLRSGALQCINEVLAPSHDIAMQKRVFTFLVDLCGGADPEEAAAVHQALRRMPLHAEAVLQCFSENSVSRVQPFDPMETLVGSSSRASKSVNGSAALAVVRPGGDGLSVRSMVVLEMLQYKQDLLGNIVILVPKLCELLKVELSASDSGEEFTKQLLLSALRWITQRIAAENVQLDPESYDIAILVGCMHSSNPSTRNHTLMLLAALAAASPELVLSEIVPVFTQMGSAAVAAEDIYTTTVIQKVLQSVLPSLLSDGGGKAVHALVRLIVDSVPSVPTHRHVPLLCCLGSALSPKTYLHGILIAIIERMRGSGDFDAILSSLCVEFTAASQLTAFWNLVEVMLHEFEDTLDASQLRHHTFASIVKAEFGALAGAQRHLMCISAICFINNHLADRRFLKKLVFDSDPRDTLGSCDAELEPACLGLFKVLLVYLRHVMELRRRLQSLEHHSKKSSVKVARQLESRVFTCLSSVQQLLPPSIFVEAITTLLAHRDFKVRNRVLTLLQDLLEQPSAADHSDRILRLLPTLQSLLTLQDATLITSPHESETPQNKQVILVCIGLMSKTFGAFDISSVSPVVRAVANATMNPNIQVVSTALLCLAGLGAQFGPLLLPQLSLLISRLEHGLTAPHGESVPTSRNNPLRAICCLASLRVLVQHMGHFLGPHINGMIKQLLQKGFHMAHGSSNRAALEWATVPAKICRTLTSIAQHIPARQLYFPMFRCLDHALEQGRESLTVYFGMIKSAMVASSRADIILHEQHLLRFFISVFTKLQNRPVDEEVETAAAKAFAALVLKLNESQFKPMFSELCSWGLAPLKQNCAVDESKSMRHRIDVMQFSHENGLWRRCSIFYRAVNELCRNLKGILVPYYRLFLDDLIWDLHCVTDRRFHQRQQQQQQTSNQAQKRMRGTKRLGADEATAALMLAELASDAAQQLFLHDSAQDVATDSVLIALVDPIAAQLDCSYGLQDEAYAHRVHKAMVPCVAQLASCSCSYEVLKPLTHALLMRTRDHLAIVRRAALVLVDAIFVRLAEEFLVLLPETVPFLVELMEDEDMTVEILVKKMIKRIESLSGISMDSLNI